MLLVSCLLWPAVGHGQEEPTGGDAAVRSAARFLANKGDEYFHGKRYERALELFQMAEALHHAPTLVLMIAKTEAQLGRLLGARNHLQGIIDEPLGPRASGPFRFAQADAQRRLAALEPRIPRLSIRLEGSAAGVEVRLDGAAIPVETLGQALPLDPGVHHIVVLGKEDVQSQTLTLVEGAREQVVFDLRPPAAPLAPTPERPSLALPILSFGVGVAGVVVGTVTGVMALDEAEQLKSTCTAGNQDCDPEARSHEDAAKGLATVSTVGFVFGGIGLTVGALLLVTGSSESAKPTETALGLRLGPGAISLEGTF
ncbi:MAG: tetratricopeptide repeat protein [Deltaproteobacteria bacterium]|nr:tetratricopeptide repeat protein [Deltaproteobacteria bacterium]